MDLKSSNIKINGISSYGKSAGTKINFGSSNNFENNISISNIYGDSNKSSLKAQKKDENSSSGSAYVSKLYKGSQKPDKKDFKVQVDKYIDKLNDEILNEVENGPRKYIDWYSGEGAEIVDWCAIFVNWIFNHNGDKKLYASHSEGDAVAGEDIKTAIKHGYGTWYESEYTDPKTTPKKGDVVAFNWVDSDSELNGGYDEKGIYHQWKYQTPQGSDHVGYVYKVDDENIYTIEGNANSYDASSATVTTKHWPRGDIRINGYYRPNYENALKK